MEGKKTDICIDSDSDISGNLTKLPYKRARISSGEKTNMISKMLGIMWQMQGQQMPAKLAVPVNYNRTSALHHTQLTKVFYWFCSSAIGSVTYRRLWTIMSLLLIPAIITAQRESLKDKDTDSDSHWLIYTHKYL